QGRHDRRVRPPAHVRVLPGLLEPRRRVAAHRQPEGPQRAPPGRDDLQGVRARAAHGPGAGSALAGRDSVDEGQPVTSTVAVVDYGMGNLKSVSQAVIKAAEGSGVDVVITQQAEQVFKADRIVL